LPIVIALAIFGTLKARETKRAASIVSNAIAWLFVITFCFLCLFLVALERSNWLNFSPR
jgi:di/tricarboxylate transporter